MNINFINQTTSKQKELFLNTLTLYPNAKNIIMQKEYFEVLFVDNIISENNREWYGEYLDYGYKEAIKIVNSLTKEHTVLTILHELHHMVQKHNKQDMSYEKPYSERPHEIEAFEVSLRLLEKHKRLNQGEVNV